MPWAHILFALYIKLSLQHIKYCPHGKKVGTTATCGVKRKSHWLVSWIRCTNVSKTTWSSSSALSLDSFFCSSCKVVTNAKLSEVRPWKSVICNWRDCTSPWAFAFVASDASRLSVVDLSLFSACSSLSINSLALAEASSTLSCSDCRSDWRLQRSLTRSSYFSAFCNETRISAKGVAQIHHRRSGVHVAI